MRKLIAICALATSLAVPQLASANDFQTVYREYKRTGTIKPCRFSDKQLRNAERETPPDVEQYAPSFLDALQAAREHSSTCGKKQAAPAAPAPSAPTPSTPTPIPQATTPAPTTPQPVQTTPTPAPTVPAQPTVSGVPSPPVQHAKRRDSTPGAVVALAVIGALGLLAALGWALARWFGWSSDGFTRPFRASCGEFADRLADFRLEFGEWLRSGH